jgi:hypothetical protein
MEAIMLVRMRVTVLLILLFASFAVAGNKKKVVLPAYVLKARTVIVLIDADAGINPEAPLANKTAQEDVDKAIAKWGWLSLVLDPQTADLVITFAKAREKSFSKRSVACPRTTGRLSFSPTTPASASARSKVARQTPLANLNRKILDLPRKPRSAIPTILSSSTKATQRVGQAAPWTNKPRHGVTATRTLYIPPTSPPWTNFAS